MNQLISDQGINFILAVLNGAFLGVLYDGIRLFRRIIKHAPWVISIEDFCFWAVGSVIIFIDIYNNNHGIIRGFLYAGVVIGLLLYYLTLSSFIIEYVLKIYEVVKNILYKLFRIIVIPFNIILKPIVFLLKKANYFLKKIFKWLIIRVKRILKEIKFMIKKI